jgi:uncharacterized protein YoxC
MTTLKKLAAATTALLVLVGPASAFTLAGSVLETDQSDISTQWQPMAAQRNDSIAKACKGFKYAGCVREFVIGNRDKFPEQFQSESDFWLYEGTTYNVPVLSGVLASAIQTQTSSSGPRPSMVEIMNGLSANQEKIATELARLSNNFGTLAVEDIDGLGDMVEQVRQQAEGFAEVQETVQRLEETYVLLQNGDLTSGMLNAIRAENASALEPVFADIKALQLADITFSQRLDVVEADVANITQQLPTTVKTEVESQLGEQLPAMTEVAETAAKEAATTAVAEVTYWSNWLAWLALAIAALAVVVVWSTRKSTNTLTETVTSHQKGTEDLYTGLAEKHEALAEEVHDENDGLAATRDLATTALSQNSTLTFLETPDLKFVNKGATSHWSMTSGDKQTDDLQTFEVRFTKREDGLFDWSVPRNQDGSGDSQPVAFKSLEKMKTKLQQAHINGRLKHCDVRLQNSKSKEAKPEELPA